MYMMPMDGWMDAWIIEHEKKTHQRLHDGVPEVVHGGVPHLLHRTEPQEAQHPVYISKYMYRILDVSAGIYMGGWVGGCVG